MLARQLNILNMKLDILYRREVGETRQAIATLHGISRWQVETWEKRARQDSRMMQAVAMRIKRDAE